MLQAEYARTITRLGHCLDQRDLPPELGLETLALMLQVVRQHTAIHQASVPPVNWSRSSPLVYLSSYQQVSFLIGKAG